MREVNFTVRFIGSLIKYLAYIAVILIAAGAALFWFDTGSWLVKPLAESAGGFFLSPMRLEIRDINGSLRNGYSLDGLRLISGDREMFTLNHASVSPDWDLVLSGMDGLPFIKSLKVRGVSSDLDSVMTIAAHFADTEQKERTETSHFPLKFNPTNIAVNNVFFGTPYANLSLDALTFDESGRLLLDALVTSGEKSLPLKADARLNLSPLEVVSSDMKIGTKGTAKLTGTIEPLNAGLYLTAISLEELMAFAPLSMDATGRIDGRIFAADRGGVISAYGVVSMPRAEVMRIPLNFRLPFMWNGNNTFSLTDATLNTKAASFTLTASGDIPAMKFYADGEGRNISLTELGKILAPDVNLLGEGGWLKFNVDTELSGDIMQALLKRTTADINADIPGISAMGINAVENLKADVNLRPGHAPRLDVNGRAFGGKLFARGEAVPDGNGGLKPDGVVVSAVNIDIPAMVRAIPQLSGAIQNPVGKISVRAKISEALDVNARVNSDRLGAFGVILTGLDASVNAGLQNMTAELEGFTANFGRGRITASGRADISGGGFNVKADANNIEPRNIPQLREILGTYNLKASASGNMNDIKGIIAEALLAGTNAGYAGITRGSINIPVTLRNGLVKIPDATITFPGSSAKLNGQANLNDETFTLNADARNLDLRFVPALRQLTGTYSLKAEASGKFSDLKTIIADALLTARNSGYNGIKLGNAEIPAKFSHGILTVQNARVTLPDGSANLNATVNVNDSTFRADADVRNLDLRFIPALRQLSGRYSLRADASGRYTDPNAITANATLTGRNMGYSGMSFGNAEVPLTFRNGIVNVQGARASLPGGTLNLKGTANIRNMNNPVLDLTASTGGINIPQLLKGLKVSGVPVTGNVKGSATVKGSASSPSFSARVEASGIKAVGFVDVPSAVVVADGNMRRVNIKKLEAKFNGSEIKGKGDILPNMRDITASRLNIDAALRHLNLKALLRNFMDKPPVEGVIDAKAGIRGTISQPYADFELTRPVFYGKTEINDIAAKVRSPRPNNYRINARARVGNFKPEADIDLKLNGGVVAYQVDTKPLDIDSAIETQMPTLAGIAKGYATVHVQGSTKPGTDIGIQAKAKEITILDKIKIQNISLPVTYMTSRNRIEMKNGTAALSGGAITSAFTADLGSKATEWRGNVKVAHLDFGKLAAPFLPEGELVGVADAQVSMKGTSTQYITLSFADGKFSTGPGYLHKMAILDRVTPTKRISFEKINGSFFWDGKDLFLNPGTGARAGNDEPLYRYFTINGSTGIQGKGLKLLCDGRFDLKILDQLLGAMKGVFQYMTGSLARNVLRDAAGRVLGVKRRDFQNVSFTLANSWDKLQLLNLKITKPIEDILPIDVLNRDEEKQRDDTQFSLRLKIPTGKGDPSVEEESPGDQFKQQLIDNLFNIGL